MPCKGKFVVVELDNDALICNADGTAFMSDYQTCGDLALDVSKDMSGCFQVWRANDTRLLKIQYSWLLNADNPRKLARTLARRKDVLAPMFLDSTLPQAFDGRVEQEVWDVFIACLRNYCFASSYPNNGWVEIPNVIQVYVRRSMRMHDGEARHSLELANYTVDEAYRCQGVLSRVIDLAKVWCSLTNKVLYIENVHDIEHHAIYKRRGFEVAHRYLTSASFIWLPK
jgi:hypothetical protein